MARRRGQWSVLVVNSVVAFTVLVLVAVLALVVKPPAPPGIAAFAPQANKPITKAPLAQSARFGNGAGQCGAGQVCSGPSASPTAGASPPPGVKPVPSATPVRGVPSALQCYTWPDGSVTQTFDPQSPPCIATWDDTKSNGGATSLGVTATEIRVALPKASANSTWPGLSPLVDFVNSHFQLYGRKIHIVTFNSKQDDEQFQGTFDDPVAQKADGAQVPALKVFASFDFVDPLNYSMSLQVFRDQLTNHRIISLAGGDTTPAGTATDLEKHAPYEWTYYPTTDVVLKNVAMMTCRELVGHMAVHAGDATLHGRPRKFAIVIPTDALIGGPLPGLSAMQGILKACGVSDVPVIRYDYAAANRGALAADFQNLSKEGVTSVIFLPQAGNTTSGPLASASQVGYHPEWVVVGTHKFLTDNMSYNQDETKGAFGVGTWNKMPQLAQEMWVQAYLAAGGRQGDIDASMLPSGRPFYNELLLLASGIQMAGPHLTPASFAAGLQATTFPNPGAGAAPSFQASVGFTPGDVTMVDDLNAFWMSQEMSGTDVADSTDNNTEKATCYVGRGRRFSLESWPTTDTFYEGACR